MTLLKIIPLVLLIAFTFIPCLSLGQEVALPSVNLGESNFLDGITGPGLLRSPANCLSQAKTINFSLQVTIDGNS